MNGPCFLVRETAALAPIKYRYTREKGVSVCLSCVGGIQGILYAYEYEYLRIFLEGTRVSGERGERGERGNRREGTGGWCVPCFP